MEFKPFTVRTSELGFVGSGLNRPECVLATAGGNLYASDRRGGVLHIRPDGSQSLIGSIPGAVPNGVALMPDGGFLIANLHGEGGVWKIERSGLHSPFLLEADGIKLAAVNFVRIDVLGRVWICSNPPLDESGRYRTEGAEGFIVLADQKGARVVADGIGWANECVVDVPTKTLFINETFGRCLARFQVADDGSLFDRQVVATFGHGTYPDGLSLGADRALWVISVASNRVIRVARDGGQHIVLEDNDPAYLEEFETAYRAHQLTRLHLTAPGGTVLQNISSIAFGGPDLRTAYLGSIAGDRIATFRCPVAGAKPVHWEW